MTLHKLKVHPQFWQAVKNASKPFEVRRDDRKYRVGDTCELSEYNPEFGYTLEPSVGYEITYILKHEDFPQGVPVGFVVLGFGKARNWDDHK